MCKNIRGRGDRLFPLDGGKYPDTQYYNFNFACCCMKMVFRILCLPSFHKQGKKLIQGNRNLPGVCVGGAIDIYIFSIIIENAIGKMCVLMRGRSSRHSPEARTLFFFLLLSRGWQPRGTCYYAIHICIGTVEVW